MARVTTTRRPAGQRRMAAVAGDRAESPALTLEVRHARSPARKTLRYGFVSTPFGRGLAAGSAQGLCYLEFAGGTDAAARARLAARWPECELLPATRRLADLAGMLAPSGGARPRLHLRGTPFQLRVWAALLEIPAGSTESYQSLARRVGDSRAARAVAGAVGANPIAVLVPCHRVVRSDGTLGGYRWGRDRKLRLLETEGAALPGGQLLGLVA